VELMKILRIVGLNFKHTTVIASLDITISSLHLNLQLLLSGGGGLYPDD